MPPTPNKWNETEGLATINNYKLLLAEAFILCLNAPN